MRGHHSPRSLPRRTSDEHPPKRRTRRGTAGGQGRHRHARPEIPRPVPCTVWPCGSTPLDPTAIWPAGLVRDITTAVLPPGCELALITTGESDVDDAVRTVRAVGRDVHILTPDTTIDPRFDLAILAVTPSTPRHEPMVAAARLLRAGGILAVLAHTTHHDGRLTDPTSAVIAQARAHGLIYLQHIVALLVPIRDGRLTPPLEESAARREHCTPHRRVHTDVLLFRPAAPRPALPPSRPRVLAERSPR